MSNNFSRGGEKILGGASPTLRPSWLRAWWHAWATMATIYKLLHNIPWAGHVFPFPSARKMWILNLNNCRCTSEISF